VVESLCSIVAKVSKVGSPNLVVDVFDQVAVDETFSIDDWGATSLVHCQNRVDQVVECECLDVLRSVRGGVESETLVNNVPPLLNSSLANNLAVNMMSEDVGGPCSLVGSCCVNNLKFTSVYLGTFSL
jgi:hypothetical protein